MSKHWQAFIILALTTFLFVIIYSFAYSHLNALPIDTFIQEFKQNFLQDKKLLLTIIGILILLVFCVRLFGDLIFPSFPCLQKFIRPIVQFTINSFGNLIEVIIFLTTIVLISRLILITFNINQEAFSIENLSGTNLNALFKEIFDILKIVGLIFLFGILSLVLHWLSRKEQGTVVVPFEDTTGGKYNGKEIADSLVAELHRIRHIHTLLTDNDTQEQNILTQSFAPVSIQENLANNLIEIGTVGIGETRLSIGRIILILKRRWPFGGINRIITGSVQVYASVTRLVVQLDYQDLSGSWEVTRSNMPVGLMPNMIEELAYKVSMYLSPNISAQKWKTFKYFTEAIASYYQYKTTGNLEYLEKTRKNCDMAIKSERDYKNIANLYYKIGTNYYEKGHLCEAEKVLNLALELKPNSSYFYNGLGNIYAAQIKLEEALNYYNIALKFNDKFSYSVNGLGNIYYFRGNYKDAVKQYKRASKLKPKLWKTYYNLGLVYSTQKRYEDAIREFKSAIKHGAKFPYPHSILGWTYLLQTVEQYRYLCKKFS